MSVHAMGDVFEYERKLLVFRGILTERNFTAAGLIWISMGKALQPDKISKKQLVFLLLFSFYAGPSLSEFVKKQR